MLARCNYRTTETLFLVFCTLFATVLAGCEKKQTPQISAKTDRHIVIIGSSANAEQWQAIISGAEKAAEDSGMATVKLLGTYPYNRKTSTQFINDAILLKPNAIAVWTLDGGVDKNALRKIREAGIKLITVGKRIDGFYDVPHVSIDYVDASRQLAGKLNDALAGQRSYALLHKRGQSEYEDACLHAFAQEADLVGQAKPIINRSISGTQKTPTELVQLMFNEYPNTGLIVSLGHEPWLTSSPYDILPEKARFAALSAVPSLVDYLRKGKATMLVAPLDGEIGSTTVDLAIESLVAQTAFGDIRVIKCEIVTKDNCEDFAARYNAAAGIASASTDRSARR